jgi:putative tryptophan/tyrosine transport system substrate-binding protein
MRRRAFLTLSAAALAATRSHAQSSRRVRIGYLSPASPIDTNLESFRAGMRERGHVEGSDHELEVRYAARDYSRIPALAQELLAAKVDLIVTAGPTTRAAPFLAQSVPVVFGFSGDPVDAGIVASFARPGGNATGVSMLQLDIASKRVELLKEIAPSISRVAIVANPDHAGVGSELRVTREAATGLGLDAELFEPNNDATLPAALEAMRTSRSDAVLVFPDALTLMHRETIAGVAVRMRAPSIFGWKVYVQSGGLVSYGPVQADAYVRLAYFVDRIIKGAKPGELPVEQPTKLELVVNLKTAKALGLNVPPTLLARADEVIE